MATKKEEAKKLVDKIIKMLKDYGYSYDEMIPVIRLAKKRFEELNSNKE